MNILSLPICVYRQAVFLTSSLYDFLAEREMLSSVDFRISGTFLLLILSQQFSSGEMFQLRLTRFLEGIVFPFCDQDARTQLLIYVYNLVKQDGPGKYLTDLTDRFHLPVRMKSHDTAHG